MYNLLAYIIFLSALFFITFRIGWIFYKNGEVFIKMLMPEDVHLVESINKLLLVGYYLTNLGYVVLSISSWETITSLQTMCEVLFMKAGGIIFLLAVMHYINISALLFYSRAKHLKPKKPVHVGPNAALLLKVQQRHKSYHAKFNPRNGKFK